MSTKFIPLAYPRNDMERMVAAGRTHIAGHGFNDFEDAHEYLLDYLADQPMKRTVGLFVIEVDTDDGAIYNCSEYDSTGREVNPSFSGMVPFHIETGAPFGFAGTPDLSAAVRESMSAETVRAPESRGVSTDDVARLIDAKLDARMSKLATADDIRAALDARASAPASKPPADKKAADKKAADKKAADKKAADKKAADKKAADKKAADKKAADKKAADKKAADKKAADKKAADKKAADKKAADKKPSTSKKPSASKKASSADAVKPADALAFFQSVFDEVVEEDPGAAKHAMRGKFDSLAGSNKTKAHFGVSGRTASRDVAAKALGVLNEQGKAHSAGEEVVEKVMADGAHRDITRSLFESFYAQSDLSDKDTAASNKQEKRKADRAAKAAADKEKKEAAAAGEPPPTTSTVVAASTAAREELVGTIPTLYNEDQLLVASALVTKALKASFKKAEEFADACQGEIPCATWIDCADIRKCKIEVTYAPPEGMGPWKPSDYDTPVIEIEGPEITSYVPTHLVKVSPGEATPAKLSSFIFGGLGKVKKAEAVKNLSAALNALVEKNAALFSGGRGFGSRVTKGTRKVKVNKSPGPLPKAAKISFDAKAISMREVLLKTLLMLRDNPIKTGNFYEEVAYAYKVMLPLFEEAEAVTAAQACAAYEANELSGLDQNKVKTAKMKIARKADDPKFVAQLAAVRPVNRKDAFRDALQGKSSKLVKEAGIKPLTDGEQFVDAAVISDGYKVVEGVECRPNYYALYDELMEAKVNAEAQGVKVSTAQAEVGNKKLRELAAILAEEDGSVTVNIEDENGVPVLGFSADGFFEYVDVRNREDDEVLEAWGRSVADGDEIVSALMRYGRQVKDGTPDRDVLVDILEGRTSEADVRSMGSASRQSTATASVPTATSFGSAAGGGSVKALNLTEANFAGLVSD